MWLYILGQNSGFVFEGDFFTNDIFLSPGSNMFFQLDQVDFL